MMLKPPSMRADNVTKLPDAPKLGDGGLTIINRLALTKMAHPQQHIAMIFHLWLQLPTNHWH